MKKIITIAILGLLATSLVGSGVLASPLSLDTLILKYFVFQDKATGRYYVKAVKGSTSIDTSTPVNPPPVADAGENKTLAQGQTADTLDGSGSTTSHSEIASYHWEQTSGLTSTISTPDSVSTVISDFNGVGDYTYMLTVTDTAGLTGTDVVTITIPPIPEYKYIISDSLDINFTPTLQGLTGYTEVAGNPNDSVITVSAPNGWTISTVDTGLWHPNPNLADGSAGWFGMPYTTPSDPFGYGMFDSAAVVTGFWNYSSEDTSGQYNLKISNLSPSTAYQIFVLGSSTYTDSASSSMYGTRTLVTASNGTSHSVNTQFSTAKTLQLDTIKSNESGVIKLNVTGQEYGYSGGSNGIINAMKVYQLSKDSGGVALTQLQQRYYDTAYIWDGARYRLCNYYLPYSYDSTKSYPLLMFMDGQEDAVKDYTWDDRVLTNDGLGYVAEHYHGKIYGIRANGDTASFFLLIPQTSNNEWSLTTSQMNNIIDNFKARFSTRINDTLDLAGFSSGADAVWRYLYKYTYKVKGAFIQSPAPGEAEDDPSVATIRDSSAKFTDYGIHVFLSKRIDGFGNHIDTIKKYVDLANPENEYTRFIYLDHSGFAFEYLLGRQDQYYEQNPYDFFVNPTMNGRRIARFEFQNSSPSQYMDWNPVIGVNHSYSNPGQEVLYGEDSTTGWGVNTVSTSAWVSPGNGHGQSGWTTLRNQIFYINQYIQTSAGVYNNGRNGNNIQITGLTPDTTYVLYLSGIGDLTHSPGDATAYVIGEDSVIQNQSVYEGSLQPARIEAQANSSGDINIMAVPAIGSYGIGRISNLIVREKYRDTSINQKPIVDAGDNQTITLPTDSVSLTGTATDPDGTITSTVWNISSQPTGASATIASVSSLTTKVTNMSIAGDYVFQLKAKDNDGDSATSSVTVTVNETPESSSFPVGDRMLIDLGGTDNSGLENANGYTTTSPQSDGRYWNTVNSPIDATVSPYTFQTYSDFIDTAGVTITGSSLKESGTASSTFGSGFNTSGNASGVGDYPASATEDSWLIKSNQADMGINLLLPAGTYTIKFWGARATSGTLTSSLTLSGTTKSYNAANNNTYTNGAVFTSVVSDGATPLVFSASAASSSNGYAYYGVLDIIRTE